MYRALGPRVEPEKSLATIDLVTGIVDDTRELVEAHIEGLREDILARLASLTAVLIAAGVFIVTAVLLALAIAASIVAAGAPWWLALWIVTPISGAIGFGFVRRARTSNHQRKQP